MCTYYEAQRKKGVRRTNHVDAVLRALDDAARGIRPTELAPVLRADGAMEIMSWGFRRQFARKDRTGKTAWKPVVNARDDKLDSPMWREALAERRCIVPVSAFYEWTGPPGQKVTHRFDQAGEIFWVAGLWEDAPEFGHCYTMLTTEPNREVAAVHDRLLVVLQETELEPWLGGATFPTFHRPDGLLRVTSPVPNPLNPDRPPPEQRELFE